MGRNRTDPARVLVFERWDVPVAFDDLGERIVTMHALDGSAGSELTVQFDFEAGHLREDWPPADVRRGRLTWSLTVQAARECQVDSAPSTDEWPCATTDGPCLAGRPALVRGDCFRAGDRIVATPLMRTRSVALPERLPRLLRASDGPWRLVDADTRPVFLLAPEGSSDRPTINRWTGTAWDRIERSEAIGRLTSAFRDGGLSLQESEAAAELALGDVDSPLHVLLEGEVSEAQALLLVPLFEADLIPGGSVETTGARTVRAGVLRRFHAPFYGLRTRVVALGGHREMPHYALAERIDECLSASGGDAWGTVRLRIDPIASTMSSECEGFFESLRVMLSDVGDAEPRALDDDLRARCSAELDALDELPNRTVTILESTLANPRLEECLASPWREPMALEDTTYDAAARIPARPGPCDCSDPRSSTEE